MLGALAFLTVLGPARTPDRRSLVWFPVVGAGLGGLLGLLWWATAEAFDPLLAAALVVVADLGLTGLLHVDGLADSADGLLPHLERERRLEVMASPGVGAFALGVVTALIGLRWIALSTQPVEPLVLVGLWMLGRTVAAATPACVPYARDRGLATAFAAGATKWVLLAVPAAAVACVAAIGWPGAAVVAASMVGGVAMVGLARARVGGYTGDVLGAAILVSETAGLVVAAAQW